MKIDRIFGLSVSVLALLFILFGVPTISEDWRKEVGAQYFTVGPRLFPYIAGTFCLIASALLTLRPEGRNNLGPLWESSARRKVLLAIGVALLYAVCLGPLGFVLATSGALILFFVIFRAGRWYLVLPLAIIIPVVVNYIFFKFFMLELPAGILALPV